MASLRQICNSCPTASTASDFSVVLIAFLTSSAIYLYAFPQANVFYAVVVLFHALGGVIATVLLLLWLWRTLRDGTPFAAIGWVLLTLGGLIGVALIWLGTSRNHWNFLYAHLALSFLGVAFMFASLARERGWFGRSTLAQIAVPLIALGLPCRPAATFASTAGRITRATASKIRLGSRDDGWRRRRSEGSIFPQLGPGVRHEKNSEQVLHGIGVVQALPRGCLQPVVQLRPSLLVVQ